MKRKLLNWFEAATNNFMWYICATNNFILINSNHFTDRVIMKLQIYSIYINTKNSKKK